MENKQCDLCKSRTDYICTIGDKKYYVCPRCGKVNEKNTTNYIKYIDLDDLPDKATDPNGGING